MSTYNERLASFKKGEVKGKKVKWSVKGQSMASLARGFFCFTPESGLRDQVTCVLCGFKVSSWNKYRGNPILRHLEGNNHCLVAQLGSLYARMQRSGSERPEPQEIISVFARTFDNYFILGDIRDQMAALGFISMPISDESIDTVGCLSCLCFPQDGHGNPQHTKKCPVPSMLVDSSCHHQFQRRSGDTGATRRIGNGTQVQAGPLSEEKVTHIMVAPFPPESSKVLNAEPAGSKRSSEVLREEVVLQSGKTQAFTPISRIPNAKSFQTVIEGMKRELQNALSTYSFKQQMRLVPELEMLEELESHIINVLQSTHARRINLICTEAETVVMNLISQFSGEDGTKQSLAFQGSLHEAS